MALYNLSDSQIKIIKELINNFPVQGNKQQIKLFDETTDEILEQLDKPVQSDTKEK